MTNKLTEQEKRFDKEFGDSEFYQLPHNVSETLGYSSRGEVYKGKAIDSNDFKVFLADEIARAERKAVEDFVDYATIRDKGTIKIIDEVNDYLHTTKYYYLAINKKGEK